jgi:hypothetical protein
VGRPRKDDAEKRVRLSAYIHPIIADWIDANIGVLKPYRDRAQLIEHAIARMMEEADAPELEKLRELERK